MIYLALVISVLIGATIVAVFKPKKKSVGLLLSFSGAYLLAITILHLLPEVFVTSHHGHSHNLSNIKEIGLFILLGILTQSILESFSKGAEHGHVHIDKKTREFPWLLFVSLCLHALSEGVPIHYQDGDELLWAIVVHKIPIAIVLTTFLYESNIPKRMCNVFILLFSLMSPIGLWSSEYFHFFNDYHQLITAFSIGIFLHISTTILFESSKNHKLSLSKFFATILGMACAFLA